MSAECLYSIVNLANTHHQQLNQSIGKFNQSIDQVIYQSASQAISLLTDIFMCIIQKKCQVAVYIFKHFNAGQQL